MCGSEGLFKTAVLKDSLSTRLGGGQGMVMRPWAGNATLLGVLPLHGHPSETGFHVLPRLTFYS